MHVKRLPISVKIRWGGDVWTHQNKGDIRVYVIKLGWLNFVDYVDWLTVVAHRRFSAIIMQEHCNQETDIKRSSSVRVQFDP
jgi:hypothetical protein